MSSRRRSRQRALQILFLWDARREPVRDALDAYYDTLFSEEQPNRDPFVSQLVDGTIQHLGEVDQRISRHAEHWRMERMPAVDRNVLRLAVFEMAHCDTPPAVVIDEALELARKFSGEESVQFVNGVLDAVHREIAGQEGASARQIPPGL
ncbi:MAG: transcription antitermination factor NusB [Acidobacteriia bacterium]|nr:transcription antitermination factor NusB [Terriglobia bacterium]MBV9744375.1 transcription antitermination factor NusB [Terriglobia bacterium]